MTLRVAVCGCRLQRVCSYLHPELLFYSVYFSQSANQAAQRKRENSQDVRMPTGERLRQEDSILCGLQFQLFRGCSAQASRELRSEKNGIFPVAA